MYVNYENLSGDLCLSDEVKYVYMEKWADLDFIQIVMGRFDSALCAENLSLKNKYNGRFSDMKEHLTLM